MLRFEVDASYEAALRLPREVVGTRKNASSALSAASVASTLAVASTSAPVHDPAVDCSLSPSPSSSLATASDGSGRGDCYHHATWPAHHQRSEDAIRRALATHALPCYLEPWMIASMQRLVQLERAGPVTAPLAGVALSADAHEAMLTRARFLAERFQATHQTLKPVAAEVEQFHAQWGNER